MTDHADRMAAATQALKRVWAADGPAGDETPQSPALDPGAAQDRSIARSMPAATTSRS